MCIASNSRVPAQIREGNGSGRPVLFPEADTPVPQPKRCRAAIAVIAEIMGQAGVDAGAIYAFRRTGGLFPSETRRLSYDETLDWSAALN